MVRPFFCLGITSLQDLIGAVQKLSPLERLDLIRALSRSLQRAYVEGDADFWHPKTLKQHVEAQDTPVITDISQLKADFWPKDESADDVIAYIYQQRSEDRLH